jgi:hypothetical protein
MSTDSVFDAGPAFLLQDRKLQILFALARERKTMRDVQMRIGRLREDLERVDEEINRERI